MAKSLSDKQRKILAAEIYSDFMKGYSLPELAHTYNVSRATAKRYVDISGKMPDRKRRTKLEMKEMAPYIIADRATGISIVGLCNKYRTSPETVKKIIKNTKTNSAVTHLVSNQMELSLLLLAITRTKDNKVKQIIRSAVAQIRALQGK